MIASVRGSVLHVGLDRVVVEVGGVGMLVHTTPGTASALRHGQETVLSTTLVVREDSLTLYGFGGGDERDMFEQVQTVSGVGPRLALAMLSVMRPDRSARRSAAPTSPPSPRCPASGRRAPSGWCSSSATRSACRRRPPPAPRPGRPSDSRWREQVTEALVGLGWSAKQADDAVERVGSTAGESPNVSEMLRAALRELGR